MGEWAAFGFYEGLSLPWPRAYGLAYRRLYENMDIVIPPNTHLVPYEPMPHCWSFTEHQVWTATGLIFGHNHYCGLIINDNIATTRKKQFPQHADFIDMLINDLRYQRFNSPQGGLFGGYTHSNPDIRRVVQEGFNAMERELDGQISTSEGAATNADREVLNLMLALKDFAAGARTFHLRTADALDRVVAGTDGEQKQKLALIARSFRNCFLNPAQTFLEGLLAINFTWMLDGCDSIGRVDQALGSLYDRDIAAGTLNPTFARQLLDEWFQSFERWNGWNLQIGGYMPNGRDGCNALTRELIAACDRNRFRRPNVAFRITHQTPDDLLNEALKALRNGSGRPALYNDDLYVKTIHAMDLGLTPEDSCEIGFGGCTETMISGMSNVGSLEGIINLAHTLALALNDGFDTIAGRQAGPHTGRFEDMAAFEQFYEAAKRQILYATDGFVYWDREQLCNRFHRGDPKLARTIFTRDCVKRRKSFEAGGARYNWAVVSYQGIGNLIDSLAAVKECVYDRQIIRREELLQALNDDFKGHEKIRKMLLAAPKFGNDIPAVDELGRDIIRFAWEALYAHETPRGGRYLPSCILFATYGNAGKEVGATPDGRYARTALVDSVGAVPGRDIHGPTALLNSVAKLPLALAIGTPVLNLRFQHNIMKTNQGLSNIAALIRSFFNKGGMQVQISVLNKEEMLAAQKDPEKHRDLLVRIGGYSEYFTNLDRPLQESVIARTEHSV